MNTNASACSISSASPGVLTPDCAAMAEPVSCPPSTAPLSNEARIWAIRQLARRAGVSREFFDSWDIDIQPAATIIHVRRGTEKQIRFRNLYHQEGDKLAGPNFHTVRAGWMCRPGEPIRSAIPDLIVPFCDHRQNGRPPLFRRVTAERIECFADLPASTLFSLCRVEETQQRRRDNCSRFSAKMSVAARDGFLDRPVVDEWGLAFGQALEALVPGWHPKQRRLRSKISHDIDEVGFGKRLWPDHLNTDTGSLARMAWMVLPFDLRHAIRLCLADHNPIAGGAHLLRTFLLGQPTCLDLIAYLAGEDYLRGLSPAIYWKASHLGPYDSGYDLRNQKIRNLIHGLRELGVEHGVHPGYSTYLRQPVLEAELRILRAVLQEPQLGGRQHYLRWCPETWRDWENAGLCYDSSVGYADQAGFRAGTCIPYRPWQLSWNREARLLEIPLVIMDATLLNYMSLRGDALLDSVRQLIDRCRMVGGVFTFLCHNTTLRDTSFAEAYGQILDMLASTAQFDWKSNLANEWSD